MNYLSTAEASKRLGIKRQWVVRLIQDERIKATQIGGRWLIHVREVERYAATRRPPGRPAKA